MYKPTKNELIDLSKLKVISQSDWGWVRHTLYEIERVDMPHKVKLTTLVVTEENGSGFTGYMRNGGVPLTPPQWHEVRRRKSISMRKKYLALGGPLDGQMVTSLDAKEYVFYNRSRGGRRLKIPSGVLMHAHWLGAKSGLDW